MNEILAIFSTVYFYRVTRYIFHGRRKQLLYGPTIFGHLQLLCRCFRIYFQRERAVPFASLIQGLETKFTQTDYDSVLQWMAVDI